MIKENVIKEKMINQNMEIDQKSIDQKEKNESKMKRRENVLIVREVTIVFCFQIFCIFDDVSVRIPTFLFLHFQWTCLSILNIFH